MMGFLALLKNPLRSKRVQIEQPRPNFFVVNEEMKEINKMMAIVSIVRLKMKESCNFSYRRVSLKKQMQQATQHRAQYAIIVGEHVAVKDMDSGEQKTLDVPRDLSSEQAVNKFIRELAKATKLP